MRFRAGLSSSGTKERRFARSRPTMRCSDTPRAKRGIDEIFRTALFARQHERTSFILAE
jgi:hypothetical protein